MSSSKSKQQGTAWQREVKHWLEVFGYHVDVLPEGGRYDEGDLWVPELNLVVECRTREQMNIHGATQKARMKARYRAAIAAVAWKRLGRKPGNIRRTQVGVPIIAMGMDDWIQLIGNGKEVDLGKELE